MKQTCSNCSSKDDLHLITLGKGIGRTLVYCPRCRSDWAKELDVSIPLSAVTEGLLIDLYKLGKTASHPLSAIKIVFGRELPDLQRKLERLLSKKHI